jgi:hypothetical protein
MMMPEDPKFIVAAKTFDYGDSAQGLRVRDMSARLFLSPDKLIRARHLRAVRLGSRHVEPNSSIIRFHMLAHKIRHLGFAIAPIVAEGRSARSVRPRGYRVSPAPATMWRGPANRSLAAVLGNTSQSQGRDVYNINMSARRIALRASLRGRDSTVRRGALVKGGAGSAKRRIGLSAGVVFAANVGLDRSGSIRGKHGFAAVDLLTRQRLAVLPSFAPLGVHENEVGSATSRDFAALGGETNSFKKGPAQKDDGPFEFSNAKVVSSTSILPGVARTVYASGEAAPIQASASNAQALRPDALGRALSEFFRRQSRLPPAGMTAFDPRLTPAWPSLKLPG